VETMRIDAYNVLGVEKIA